MTRSLPSPIHGGGWPKGPGEGVAPLLLLIFSLVCLPSPRLNAASPSDILQDAAADYRRGDSFSALSKMTRVLEEDPENPTAKNFIWVMARELKKQDDASLLGPGEKKRAVALALRHLRERERHTREVVQRLKQVNQATQGARSPGDILSAVEGLERFLGTEFEEEFQNTQAHAYFQNILDQLNTSLKSKVFVSKKDRFRAEGYLAYYQKDWDQAISKWTLALQEDPSDTSLEGDLTSLKEIVSRRAKARKIEELSKQAQAFSKSGYLEEALRSWKEILVLNPQHPTAREQAALVRVSIEKINQRDRLKRQTNEGLEMYKKGDYLGGAQVWLSVLQQDPTFEDARVLLALVGKKIKEIEPSRPAPAVSAPKAEKGKEEPPSVSKEESERYYRQGLLLYSEEKLAEAVVMWEKAIRQDPSNSRARQALDQARTELAFH